MQNAQRFQEFVAGQRIPSADIPIYDGETYIAWRDDEEPPDGGIGCLEIVDAWRNTYGGHTVRVCGAYVVALSTDEIHRLADESREQDPGLPWAADFFGGRRER